MSRDTAKGFYDRSANDPFDGYITAQDAQAAIDVIYDDLTVARGSFGVASVQYASVSGLVTVAHPLGVTPSYVAVTPSLGYNKGAAAAGIVYHVYDATTTQFRVQHSQDGLAVTDPGREIGFYWEAAATLGIQLLPAPDPDPTPEQHEEDR